MIQSNTLIVGAPFDETGGLRTGSVYLYEEVSENMWGLVHKLVNGSDGDRFGTSLDIDEMSTVAIGASVSSFKLWRTLYYIISSIIS